VTEKIKSNSVINGCCQIMSQLLKFDEITSQLLDIPVILFYNNINAVTGGAHDINTYLQEDLKNGNIS